MPSSAVLDAEPVTASNPEVQPTHDQWRALYKAAQAFRNISPWTFVTDTEYFGVVDPASGKTWYLSVRGSAGEPYGLIAFNGPAALAVVERLNTGLADESPEALHDYADVIPEHDYVIAAFGDRTELLEDDLAIIQDLKLKFHGARDWPLFRSVRRHSIDWFVNAAEVHVLTLALVQALDVARRRRSQPGLLESGTEKLLVRTSDSGVWTDERREREAVPIAPPAGAVAFPDEFGDEAKKLPKGSEIVELDHFWNGTITGDAVSEPQHFVRQMLVVGGDDESVLYPHLLPLDDYGNQLAIGLVLSTLASNERFATVQVRKPELATILGPTAKALDIAIEVVPKLDKITKSRATLGLNPIQALQTGNVE